MKKTEKNASTAMTTLLMAATKKEVKESIPKIRSYVHKERNKLEYCPFCERRIADREESLYRELIVDLAKVYRWCGEHKRHEFEMSDIRHLLSKVNYTRFGNLDHYGGIVYKPDKTGPKNKGDFGIHMARAKEFFEGTRDIPIKRTVSLITGQTIAEVRGYVFDIPRLVDFLDENGIYDPKAHIVIEKPAAPSRTREQLVKDNRARLREFDRMK